jgi:hypothetical protein
VSEPLELLRDQAASLEDFTMPPPTGDFLWTVTTNSHNTTNVIELPERSEGDITRARAHSYIYIGARA